MSRRDVKINIGFYGKIEENLKRKLRYLEPNGASKRTLYLLPQTIDKAYKEMYTTQENFNSEREQLRAELNTPIRSIRNDFFMDGHKKNYRQVDNTVSASQIMAKHHNYRLMMSKSPELALDTSDSFRRIETIDTLIDSCADLHKSNQTLLRKFPSVKRIVEREFKSAKRIVHRLKIAPFRKNNFLSKDKKFER